MQDFSALVSSRICHDLISPLGAIGNGLELMALQGASPSPELALIVESFENANARLQFFRVAFGAAEPDQRIARDRVLMILREEARGGKVVYHWNSGDDLPRDAVRRVFLALLCLGAALPHGGAIHIEATHQGWFLEARSSRLHVDERDWQGLMGANGGPNATTPAKIEFLLLAAELNQSGRIPVVSIGADQISVAF